MTNTDSVIHTFEATPDPDVWNVVNADIVDGAAVYSEIVGGYVTSPTGISFGGPPAAEMYDFTSVYFVAAVQATGDLNLGTESRTWIYGANTHSCGFEIAGYPDLYVDDLQIRTYVTINDETTYSARAPYGPAHRWLRVSRSGSTLTFESRSDAAASWSIVSTFTDAAVSSWPQVRIWTAGTRCSLWAINTEAGTDPPLEYGDPGYDPVGTQPADVPDNFDPDATLPDDPIPAGCSPLLALVKDFSAMVRRAVRITGPASIEMVEPNAPLPDGWYIEDAEEMYATTEHTIQAGAADLSYAYENLEMSASASVVRNDVRLLVSTWRIPDRVPAYELEAGPVKRITHMFTPKDYTASLEYYVPVVPTAARRP